MVREAGVLSGRVNMLLSLRTIEALALSIGDITEDFLLVIYSRRKRSHERFPRMADALAKVPASTVINGKLCTLDKSGGTDFNLLKNCRFTEAQIQYFAFDIL